MAVVTSTIGHNLPGPKMGDDLIRALDARADMCRVKSIRFASSLTLRVYQRHDLGCPQRSTKLGGNDVGDSRDGSLFAVRRMRCGVSLLATTQRTRGIFTEMLARQSPTNEVILEQ